MPRDSSAKILTFLPSGASPLFSFPTAEAVVVPSCYLLKSRDDIGRTKSQNVGL